MSELARLRVGPIVGPVVPPPSGTSATVRLCDYDPNAPFGVEELPGWARPPELPAWAQADDGRRPAARFVWPWDSPPVRIDIRWIDPADGAKLWDFAYRYARMLEAYDDLMRQRLEE